MKFFFDVFFWIWERMTYITVELRLFAPNTSLELDGMDVQRRELGLEVHFDCLIALLARVHLVFSLN